MFVESIIFSDACQPVTALPTRHVSPLVPRLQLLTFTLDDRGKTGALAVARCGSSTCSRLRSRFCGKVLLARVRRNYGSQDTTLLTRLFTGTQGRGHGARFLLYVNAWKLWSAKNRITKRVRAKKNPRRHLLLSTDPRSILFASIPLLFLPPYYLSLPLFTLMRVYDLCATGGM